MAVISMKQLLEAGVHFGHQTRRWNPKMAKYIFTERNGIHVIDLQQTVKMADTAYEFVREAAANDAVILFVGTKKQAAEAVAEEAIENGLLSEAATKTQSTIKKYLNAIPGIDGNYEIKVKFLETKKES